MCVETIINNQHCSCLSVFSVYTRQLTVPCFLVSACFSATLFDTRLAMSAGPQRTMPVFALDEQLPWKQTTNQAWKKKITRSLNIKTTQSHVENVFKQSLNTVCYCKKCIITVLYNVLSFLQDLNQIRYNINFLCFSFISLMPQHIVHTCIHNITKYQMTTCMSKHTKTVFQLSVLVFTAHNFTVVGSLSLISSTLFPAAKKLTVLYPPKTRQQVKSWIFPSGVGQKPKTELKGE